jgi:hypothetical protein
MVIGWTIGSPPACSNSSRDFSVSTRACGSYIAHSSPMRRHA